MSDSRTISRVRLTTAERGGGDKPLAKPIAAGLIVQPAASVRPGLITEQFLDFPSTLALDELTSRLRVTGFESFEEEYEQKVEETAAVPDTPAPSPITLSIQRPVLEVKPATATAAVYEPMEFLDYDDEEDTYGSFEPEPVETFTPPAALTAFLPVPEPRDAAPDSAKLQQGFSSASFVDAPVEIPVLALQTIRKKLRYGPNPFKPAPAPESPKPAVQAPPVQSPNVQAPAAIKSNPVTKTAPPPPRISPPVVQRPAAAAAAAAPVIKAEPARTEQPRPEKDKRPAAKAVPPPPPQTQRPAPARGNAVPIEEVVEESAAPLPKPKMVPIRKPEPLAPAASTAMSEGPMLGLPTTERSSGSKIAIAAAVAVALLGGGYMMFSGGGSSANAAVERASESSPGMIVGGGGWTTTWGSDSPNNKGKQISIYRPSMPMTDYRFEFRGQIEKKALGWLFRASNPKNYYVMKLESIKGGPNPLVALIKYAVIDGKEQTRTQVMLPFEVKVGTIYHVRLDVKGDKFATYVQDKLVDHWNDDRIKVGGAGFYTETGERSQIKSSQVSYLN